MGECSFTTLAVDTSDTGLAVLLQLWCRSIDFAKTWLLHFRILFIDMKKMAPSLNRIKVKINIQ